MIATLTCASVCFLVDPKRLNRFIFGAWYEEDVYDRFCSRFPAAMRAFHWRIPAAMRARNLIFVHVPRAAGTSIVRAIYGDTGIRHHSMRYYRAIDPDFARKADSFALLRDPVDRFASAYAFVRGGGATIGRLSDVFVRQTRNVTSVDSYLSFLEERGPLDLDFVMRPQSWFVCDHAGAPLVKNLFLYGEDDVALSRYLSSRRIGPLPWLNRTERGSLMLSALQRSRIERVYARDFALIDSVRSAREKGAPGLFPGASIAAE